MANPEETYIKVGGRAWKSNPEQADAYASDGAKVISKEEALTNTRALDDLSYVDQNWGTAGKLGQGVISGLSLGLIPGVGDPNHILAAQTSPWYTAGDIAGTVLPSLLSGGESNFLRMSPAGMLEGAGSTTEKLVGRLLGENTGVLGRTAMTPAKMAARGAVEGAAITLGHSIGTGQITNAPLSGESMLAAGLDGALMGGLIGGSLGTVGSLGSLAVNGLGKAAKDAVGRSGAREGLWAKRLNLGTEDVLEAKAGAGMDSLAGKVQEGLEKGGTGARIGSSDETLQKGFKVSKDVYTKEELETLAALDKQASHLTPDFEHRMTARLDEIVASRGPAEAEAVQKTIQKVKDQLDTAIPKQVLEGVKVPTKKIAAGTDGPMHLREVARTEPGYEIPGMTVPSSTEAPTWSSWAKNRDFIAKDLTGNPLKREIMSAIDSEIRSSMEAADAIPGLEGVSGKYASAKAGAALMGMLEESVGKKAAQKLMSTTPGITAGDLGRAAMFGAVLQNPIAAAGWLAQKGLGRAVTERFEPALAQMAFDMSVGQKATAATSQVRERIGTSIKAFFKAPTKGAQTYSAESYIRPKTDQLTREKYEKLASKAEQLVSSNHQDRVNRYAEALASSGYQDLAKSILETNARAVNYTLYNMPARQGTKALGSMRKQPSSHVPTLKEYGFTKKVGGIFNPASVLDDLENGTLSREKVAAVKYVYPEIHTEICQAVGTEIYNKKMAGEFMPMSKIAGLGILLDSPVDSTLTADYIGAVQIALTSPPAEQQDPVGQASGQSAPMSQDLMTPLQKAQTV